VADILLSTVEGRNELASSIWRTRKHHLSWI